MELTFENVIFPDEAFRLSVAVVGNQGGEREKYEARVY